LNYVAQTAALDAAIGVAGRLHRWMRQLLRGSGDLSGNGATGDRADDDGSAQAVRKVRLHHFLKFGFKTSRPVKSRDQKNS
jgi:hypothetical protein